VEFSLTSQERHTLLRAAREAISARLQQREPRPVESTATLKKKCGAFVTLHKHGKLRGCIGFVVGRAPLLDTVQEAARSAAFHDPRFPPLTPGELEDVRLEISVLSPLQPVRDPEEIEVGVHGIMLRQGYYSGLLLPQVATEQGWDRDTFLTHTCYKAGLPADCWRSADTVIEIFSAVVFGEEEQP
jgi:AmmeMemoRadiSam system protein A